MKEILTIIAILSVITMFGILMLKIIDWCYDKDTPSDYAEYLRGQYTKYNVPSNYTVTTTYNYKPKSKKKRKIHNSKYFRNK